MRQNTIVCNALLDYQLLKVKDNDFLQLVYMPISGDAKMFLDESRVTGGVRPPAQESSAIARLNIPSSGLILLPEAPVHCVANESCEANSPETIFDEYEGDVDDEDNAAAIKSTRTPQIQPMRDYILRNYTERMRKELCQHLLSGRLSINSRVVAVYADTFKVGKMSFWREGTRACMAYVQLTVDLVEQVRGQERLARNNYAAQITFDMTWENIETDVSYGYYSKTSEEYWAKTMWKLDDYLVPVFTKAMIEEEAWLLHCRHFPERSETPEEIRREFDAYEMARRMGLEVKSLPLHGKKSTKGLLFFCEDRVQIDTDLPDGKKGTEWVDVPGDCIVLNTNAMHKDEYQLEVFHECIHYEWHYMFYRLQEMHINDLRKLKKTPIDKQHQRRAKVSIDYLEHQARWGSFALMMPLPVMTPLVADLIEKYKPSSRHAGDMFSRIIRTIHTDRSHAIFRIRARLIQMGYVEAKGALNYVDGKYIAPFAFSRRNSEGNYTFVIDRKGIAKEYRENPAFREQIRTGQYVYVDGHICVNSPEYVMQTSQGPRLTAWAEAHVDECCLRFQSIYIQNEVSEYEFGRLACDEEYNKHYLNYVDPEGKLSVGAAYRQIRTFLNGLPSGFFAALDFLRLEKKMTQEKLEEVSGVSAKKIARERKKTKWSLSRDEVIGLCIGLNMPPWLSQEMLKRAHVALDDKDPTDMMYSMILELHFMDKITDIQQLLRSEGCEELELAC